MNRRNFLIGAAVALAVRPDEAKTRALNALLDNASFTHLPSRTHDLDHAAEARFTDSSAWHIQGDPQGIKLFKHTRPPVRRWMDGDFDEMNMRYKRRERISAFYGSSV